MIIIITLRYVKTGGSDITRFLRERRRGQKNPCGRLTDSFAVAGKECCCCYRYAASAVPPPPYALYIIIVLPIFFRARDTPTDRTSSILRAVVRRRRRHLGDLMNFCPLYSGGPGGSFFPTATAAATVTATAAAVLRFPAGRFPFFFRYNNIII